MRPELENMKYAEMFLRNELTTEEILDFKTKVGEDSDLKLSLAFMRYFKNSVDLEYQSFILFKAKKAYSNYLYAKIITIAASVVTASIVISSIIYGIVIYQKKNEKPFKPEKQVISITDSTETKEINKEKKSIEEVMDLISGKQWELSKNESSMTDAETIFMFEIFGDSINGFKGNLYMQDSVGPIEKWCEASVLISNKILSFKPYIIRGFGQKKSKRNLNNKLKFSWSYNDSQKCIVLTRRDKKYTYRKRN